MGAEMFGQAHGSRRITVALDFAQPLVAKGVALAFKGWRRSAQIMRQLDDARFAAKGALKQALGAMLRRDGHCRDQYKSNDKAHADSPFRAGLKYPRRGYSQ